MQLLLDNCVAHNAHTDPQSAYKVLSRKVNRQHFLAHLYGEGALDPHPIQVELVI